MSQFDSVLIGLAPDEFNYKQLNQAFHAIHYHNAQLYAINQSRYYKDDFGKNSLGNVKFFFLQNCSHKQKTKTCNVSI